MKDFKKNIYIYITSYLLRRDGRRREHGVAAEPGQGDVAGAEGVGT